MWAIAHETLGVLSIYFHGQLALESLEHRVCPVSVRYRVVLVPSGSYEVSSWYVAFS